MTLAEAEADALTLRWHEPPWQASVKVRSGLIEMKPLRGATDKINWVRGWAAWFSDVLTLHYASCYGSLGVKRRSSLD